MIDLGGLPRGTTYEFTQVTYATDLSASFGGTDLRLNRAGDRWQLAVTVPSLRYADCGMAQLADLTAGYAQGVSLEIPQPGLVHRGEPGSLVVDGGSQAGTTLNIGGGNQNFLFRKGQMVSVKKTVGAGTRRYLYMATAATRIDGAGEATLSIWPALRRAPANGDVVEVLKPRIEGNIMERGLAWRPNRFGALELAFTIREIA